MLEKNMAASGPSNDDYFYPGSIVKCTTCHGDDIQGEVTAFDRGTKILVLKQPSACGKPELNNVAMLNVDFIKSVTIIKETETPLSPLPALNSSKLFERYKEEITLKMMLARALSAGVTNEGIKLFKVLRKTMPAKDVMWSDLNILVMDEVLVKPPYNPENCVPADSKIVNASNPCLNHVKNIVEKFHKEERSKVQPLGAT